MKVAGLEGVTQQSGVVLESTQFSIKLAHLGLNLQTKKKNKSRNIATFFNAASTMQKYL